MERAQVLEAIQELVTLRPVEVTDASRLRVRPNPDEEGFLLRTAPRGREYSVGAEQVSKMLAFANVPASLAQRISPDTTARAVTESIQSRGAVTVLTNDGQAIDITPPGRYHRIEPERVFRTIDREIPNFEVAEFRQMPNHSVALELLGVDEPRPVPHGHDAVRGELIRAGVMVEFSPIGVIDPQVMAYAQRLVCTNGAISMDVVRQFHFGRRGPGEGDDIWQWFRQSARDAYGAIDRIVARYAQMQQEELSAEDRALVLAAMIREAGLGNQAKEAVMARALEEPPQNAFDVYNLITWASSHVEQDTRRVRRAQLAAARFADTDEHNRFCPTCRRNR